MISAISSWKKLIHFQIVSFEVPYKTDYNNLHIWKYSFQIVVESQKKSVTNAIAQRSHWIIYLSASSKLIFPRRHHSFMCKLFQKQISCFYCCDCYQHCIDQNSFICYWFVILWSTFYTTKYCYNKLHSFFFIISLFNFHHLILLPFLIKMRKIGKKKSNYFHFCYFNLINFLKGFCRLTNHSKLMVWRIWFELNIK